MGKSKQKDNVILFISDLHAPYNHKDAIAFLAKIKEVYRPTKVINVGDEVDYHAMSFHASDPDLDSASVELIKARATIQQLERLFPVMELVNSNHGSMVYRKAKVNGMPRHVLKGYNEILGVGEGWTWSDDIFLSKENIYVCHGRKKNSEAYAKQMGCNVVQGHFHEDFRIGYTNAPMKTVWGMNVGCLIDDESKAYAYNKVNPNAPMIGTGIVINGVPRLIPMNLDKKGNWDGKC
jgi:predicted phosphodiesterase